MIDFTNLWTGLDWFILAVYFVAVLGVGVLMHKRANKSFKSFFVASRRLTIPVLVGVAAAGWYDSWTIVGLAECGWTMGISVLFIYVFPASFLRLPLAVIIGPLVRDKMPDYVVTLPDMICYFYDKRTKFISAVTIAVGILYDAALLFAIGQVMHLVAGVPIYVAMVIAGGIILAYTSLAGLWGLAVTDMIQFAVMTVSAGVLAWGILSQPGGLPGIFEQIKAVDPLLLTPLGHNSSLDVLAWVIAAASLYVNAQSYQRFGAAKSGSDIKVAYSLMMIIGMSFSAVMVMAGMAASVLFPAAASPAEGFWAAVFTVLPAGLRGLFVAALCAAVMSTVSADWLVSSTALVNDLYRGFINPRMTDASVLRSTKVVLIFISIFCVAGTYFWQAGIGKAWYYLGGFQTAVFFIPILAGLFYKKKTATGGFIAVLAGVLIYITWEFILKAPFGVPSNVATWVSSLVIYFIACTATYKGTEVKSQ